MRTLRIDPLDYAVGITQDHDDFRRAVQTFAEKEIAPVAKRIDSEGKIPPALLDSCRKMGLFGVTVPREYGGAGADTLSLALAVEQIARCSGAISAVILASYLLTDPLVHAGTAEQKARWLPRLASGEFIGAHAMTEPAAGSDVAGIQTKAVREGSHWVIDGRKHFITNGDISGLLLVFARTSPPPSDAKRHLGLTAFLVERNTPGLSVEGRIETMGLRGSHPVSLLLEDVRVPAENILGSEGEGAYVAFNAYDGGRISVASQGVGLAQSALEASIAYAGTRKAFGSSLLDFQQVQFKLAEMASRVHSARLLTYWAASLRDQGKEFVMAASIAKIAATEAAEKVALDGILIHGGYGVSVEYGVERILRDSQIIKTYEGTTDIQRLTIAKRLIAEARDARARA